MSDVAYDNPFAKVSSRQSLISHFILLHLVSCGQLPPLSSRSLFSLATSISKQVLGYANVIGDEGTEVSNAKGKEKAEIGLGIHHTGETDLLKNGDLSFETIKPIKGLGGAHQSDTEGGGPSWWRLWDVTAECRELGSIECYGASLSVTNALELMFTTIGRWLSHRSDRSVSPSTADGQSIRAFAHLCWQSRLVFHLPQHCQNPFHVTSLRYVHVTLESRARRYRGTD